MRRVLLFAAFLLLLGLTTATAASFDVQAEDITSFSEAVNIEVPGPPPLTGTLYIRSDGLSIPGELAVSVPPPDNGVNKRAITASSIDLAAQGNSTMYHSWVLVSPTAGYTLRGQIELTMFQDGDNAPQMTAGLFICDVSVLDGDEDACTEIARGTGSQGTANGNQMEARQVIFTPINSTPLLFGTELRLKVVNNSASDWSIRWGWNDSFPARLEIT